MDVEIIRGGSSYTLTVQADDGLGMAPLHRLTQRGPEQHGDTDLGFRLDPRVFSLLLALRGTSLSNLYSLRETLMDWLTPGVDLSLLFTRGDGAERQIDCAVIDAPMGHDVTQVWAAQTIGARFQAMDPTFYDPTVEVETLPGVAGTWDHTLSITYAGNWRAFPYRIRITGPVDDPVLTNTGTEDKLDFTGFSLAAGEYVDIDCRFNQKTVEDDGGVNQVDVLSDDSDLASFHLATDPQVAGGVNAIHVAGDNVTVAASVTVLYYTRYLGI